MTDIDRMEAASRLYDIAYQAGQRDLMKFCELALAMMEKEKDIQPPPVLPQDGLSGEGVGTRPNGA